MQKANPRATKQQQSGRKARGEAAAVVQSSRKHQELSLPCSGHSSTWCISNCNLIPAFLHGAPVGADTTILNAICASELQKQKSSPNLGHGVRLRQGAPNKHLQVTLNPKRKFLWAIKGNLSRGQKDLWISPSAVQEILKALSDSLHFHRAGSIF